MLNDLQLFSLIKGYWARWACLSLNVGLTENPEQ